MGSFTFSFLKVREAVQKRNVTTKWGTLKGGGAAPTIKKSLIQNVDCFEMRGNSYRNWSVLLFIQVIASPAPVSTWCAGPGGPPWSLWTRWRTTLTLKSATTRRQQQCEPCRVSYSPGWRQAVHVHHTSQGCRDQLPQDLGLCPPYGKQWGWPGC